jgi:arginyl-tRNA synthetase
MLPRDLGYVAQLAAIQRTLDGFGVHFDVWFSEKTLHDGGAVEQAVARLREQGHVVRPRRCGVAAHDRLR